MIDNDATIQSNKEKRWFRIAIEVFALGALVGITGVYLFILAWDIVQQASWIQRVFQEHAEAVLGLPLVHLSLSVQFYRWRQSRGQLSSRS